MTWVEKRKQSTVAVLGRLKAEAPAAWSAARVVGRWVWVTFKVKPDAGVLTVMKTIGFTWSRRRSAWQHPCGHWSAPARGYDPREKYGEVRADAVKLAV